MNGIEGQEDDYKRRELQPHWVPGGDHESTDERVNEPTSEQTNKRTSCNIEADESTPSYRRTPVVGWSTLINPWAKGRKLFFYLYTYSMVTVYVACGVLIPCPGYPRSAVCRFRNRRKLHCWTIGTMRSQRCRQLNVHDIRRKGK